MENTNPTQDSQDQVNDAAQADTDELSQKLAEYENKLGEMRDVLLRERAEIENQRKRLQRDLDQARRFANERVLSDLLPVCDSLERGLAVQTADAGSLREGMELTLKALLKVADCAIVTRPFCRDAAWFFEANPALALVEVDDDVIRECRDGALLASAGVNLHASGDGAAERVVAVPEECCAALETDLTAADGIALMELGVNRIGRCRVGHRSGRRAGEQDADHRRQRQRDSPCAQGQWG